MIVQNPHTKNPQELWKMLERQQKAEEPKEEVFDQSGFDRLRGALDKNPRFIVK